MLLVIDADRLIRRLYRLHALILVYQATSVYDLAVMLFVTCTDRLVRGALQAPCTDKCSSSCRCI